MMCMTSKEETDVYYSLCMHIGKIHGGRGLGQGQWHQDAIDLKNFSPSSFDHCCSAGHCSCIPGDLVIAMYSTQVILGMCRGDDCRYQLLVTLKIETKNQVIK